MALSEFAARKAKPREKPYKLADGGGLYLHVQPNGSKLWRVKYRFGGKEKLLSCGPYPLISIAEARAKREEAKQQLAGGLDPANQKKLDRLAAETTSRQTFALIADEYIAQMETNGAAERTIAKTRWLLGDLASPLAKRPVREIVPAETSDLLKKVELSGRRETAKRLRGAIGSVFRFAIVTLRAESDPTGALRGALVAPKVTGRAIDRRRFGSPRMKSLQAFLKLRVHCLVSFLNSISPPLWMRWSNC